MIVKRHAFGSFIPLHGFFISHTEALPNLFFVFKEYSCQLVVIKVKESASILLFMDNKS